MPPRRDTSITFTFKISSERAAADEHYRILGAILVNHITVDDAHLNYQECTCTFSGTMISYGILASTLIQILRALGEGQTAELIGIECAISPFGRL